MLQPFTSHRTSHPGGGVSENGCAASEGASDPDWPEGRFCRFALTSAIRSSAEVAASAWRSSRFAARVRHCRLFLGVRLCMLASLCRRWKEGRPTWSCREVIAQRWPCQQQRATSDTRQYSTATLSEARSYKLSLTTIVRSKLQGQRRQWYRSHDCKSRV